MIYILTGVIQSGKSTSLTEWIKTNGIEAGGFLTPVDENGKKVLFDLAQQRNLVFELDGQNSDKNTISVGRFIFDADTFEQAIEWTKRQIDSDLPWIIIDEIGKLEMNNLGFHELVNFLLENKGEQKNFLFVVRDTLLDQVKQKYGLTRNQVSAIGKEELKDMF